MAQKVSGRLQTPVDEQGERKDIHLITTTDEVIVNTDLGGTGDTGNARTLTDYLKGTKLVIKEKTDTTTPKGPCFVFKKK